jgi:flagellar hook-associated protein 1 FlgK
MSIGSILSNALSGLNASQSALGVISQNVANANTPGYVRAEARFTPQVVAGMGAGVSLEAITRAADRFLAETQRLAGAAGAASSARADLLDRAQALFGDPNGDQTFFTRIDDVFDALQAVALDPTSSVARRTVVSTLQDAFGEFSRVTHAIEALRIEADQRVGEAVARADNLLQRISELNGQVTLSRKAGSDSTGAENARGQLIDELATFMDVRVTEKADGAVELRTNTGALLVGLTAARLSYTESATVYGPAGSIRIAHGDAGDADFGPLLSGGLIKGLMAVRDTDLPSLSQAVGALAAGMADALNNQHTANTSSPAASQVVGRNTGLIATDALNFTGGSVIGVMDANGVLARRLTIDFGAGTITTENPANTQTFAQTVGAFTTALNAALQLAPAQGTASFVDGVLRIQSPTGAAGFAITDAPGNSSSRAGRGFEHFFGLNELIRSDSAATFTNGMSEADPHGLNSGGYVRFRVTDPAGRIVLERNVNVAGTSWTDFIAEINSGSGGVGQYGGASFDGNGNLVVAGLPGYSIVAIEDATERGATGLGVTDLFVLNPARISARVHEFRVDASIVAAPERLQLARPDLTSAVGERVVEAGDSRGAQALLNTRDLNRFFAASGAMSAQSATLALYASRLAGEAARMADGAAKTEAGAQAVLTAATERRAQAEGVSIDEEMIRMTQFQQSYAAASRLIQAAREMVDILLSLK